MISCKATWESSKVNIGLTSNVVAAAFVVVLVVVVVVSK